MTTSTEVRSPTSTRTEVRSPTSTQTDAYTQGNFTATVTGGAGAGGTTVNIYPGSRPAPTPREARPAVSPQEAWAKLFQPSDVGAEEPPGAALPLLFIAGVGGLLIWATLDNERKRRRPSSGTSQGRARA